MRPVSRDDIKDKWDYIGFTALRATGFGSAKDEVEAWRRQPDLPAGTGNIWVDYE